MELSVGVLVPASFCSSSGIDSAGLEGEVYKSAASNSFSVDLDLNAPDKDNHVIECA